MADVLGIARDRYRNVKYLAQGYFARVFRAERICDGITVAIKEINLNFIGQTRPDDEEKANFRQMARQEYEIMAAARHPNIVAVFDYYSQGDIIHVLMEYCDSGTLQDAIKSTKNRPYPESQIWMWTAQLALALNHLHQVRHVLHRDVKADNIFLTYNGMFLKLGDFGISKQLERMSQSARTGWGTFTHQAPELFRGNGFTTKSEIWALGVVAYHAAARKLPFEGNDETIMFGIVGGEPVPITSENYSAELNSFIVEKLLNKDPDRRPAAVEILEHPRIREALLDMGTYGTTPELSRTLDFNATRSDHMLSRQQSSLNVTPTGTSELPPQNGGPVDNRADAIKRTYFRRYPRHPKDFFDKAPSPIYGIVVVPNKTGDRHRSTILLVCQGGEIIALSNRDWVTIEWQCKVKLPTQKYLLNIHHAVYDSASDEIYFVNCNFDNVVQPIFRTSLSSLRKASMSGTVVELGILLSESQADGRCFKTLTIDSANRFLYACDFYGAKHKDISIWLLPSSITSSSPKLVGSIKTGYQPFSCSFHIESHSLEPQNEPSRRRSVSAGTPNSIGLVINFAISDFWGNRVDLLCGDWKQYVNRIIGQTTALAKKTGKPDFVQFNVEGANRRNNVAPEAILKRIDFIARCEPGEESKLGTVWCPCELAFDATGNLFVSQNGEGVERIQAFAFSEGASASPMVPVWSSSQVGPYCHRLAVVAIKRTAPGGLRRAATNVGNNNQQENQPNQAPCIITNGSSGMQAIAIFEQAPIV